MKRYGYLKHYNNATQGSSFQTLLLRKKPYAILLFWYFLERCNQENSSKIEVTYAELQATFHKRVATLLKEVEELCKVFDKVCVKFDQKVSKSLNIEIVNYSEFQEMRGGARSFLKSKKSTIKIEDKDKDKDINKTTNVVFTGERSGGASPVPELSSDERVVIFLKNVKTTTQRNWLKIYDDPEFITREILKAVNWLELNPSRSPKTERGISSFMTRWLDRAWEHYRKTNYKKAESLEDIVSKLRE